MRWFPRFIAGLAMMLLSGAAFIILFFPHGDPRSWLGLVWLVFTVVSFGLCAIGAYGVITGGRHTAGQRIHSSSWGRRKKAHPAQDATESKSRQP